jgi:dihydrofolate reductase
MRRILVNTFLTLDGVMQAPGGPEEDMSGGFEHGGWSVHYWDDLMGEIMDESFAVPFDLLLGRRTYEIFAAYWPSAPEEAGPTKLFNEATKYVVSRGRPSLDWGPAVLVGDAAEGVAELKKGEGPELQIHGSGNLIQTLIRNGLVDVYRLWFFPVLVGSGKRLFADGVLPGSLRLVDSKVSTTGVQIGTYEPAGELVTGTFGAN